MPQRFEGGSEGVEGEIKRLKEEEGDGEGMWDVKVGVWRGDLFVV